MKEKQRLYYKIGITAQITFLLVGPVVLLLFLGLWLDNLLHTSPLFVILGVIFGFIGSIFNVFRVIELMNKT